MDNISCYVENEKLKEHGYLERLARDPNFLPGFRHTIFSYDTSTFKVVIVQRTRGVSVQTILLTPDETRHRATELIEIADHLEKEYTKRFPVQTAKEGETSCSICFENLCQAALVPCGHSGFCGKCCIGLQTCPMCRAKVDSILRVYP